MPEIADWPTLERVDRNESKHQQEIEELCPPHKTPKVCGWEDADVEKEDRCLDCAQGDGVEDLANVPDLEGGVDLPELLVPQWLPCVELDFCNRPVRLRACVVSESSLVGCN